MPLVPKNLIRPAAAAPRSPQRGTPAPSTPISLLALSVLCTLLPSCAHETELREQAAKPADGAYRNAPAGRPLPPAGRWWGAFGDPVLDVLVDKLDAANPSLAAALARYDRSRAELGLARADRFPILRGEISGSRRRDSGSGVFVPTDLTYNEFRTALNLQYEIDLWGRVRRLVEAAAAESAAAEADWAAARLSLRAELARNYFQLRYLDAEIAVLRETERTREENRSLAEARVRGGEAVDLDLARAETEFESTRAERHRLERERDAYLHAVAALCGESPASFTLPKGGLRRPPSLPAGIPSDLLSRRPDVRAAEHRLEAAASRLDSVKVSYLPRINLLGSGGLSSLDLGDLLSTSSLFGEIGPSIEVPIYNAGRARADRGKAEADAEEAAALYRESILASLREVEDALSAIRHLDREIGAHERAADAADRATRLSRTRYEGGLVSFLEVVDAERSALEARRSVVQAKSARLVQTVLLVQALGGGWGG